MTRDQAMRRFADAHGQSAANIALLAQDASFRRYFRLTGGAEPIVLMDAPPDKEDMAPFLRLRAALEAGGISVPRLLAADQQAGLLLLEDLGDSLFPAILSPATQDTLYDAATLTLAALHDIPPPPALPRWLAAEMVPATMATFLDWWWPAMFGAPPAATIRADFTTAMHRMLAPLDAGPLTLIHRDYFAGNLFWLPDRTGPRRVGVIDFQDAALGHPAYDLVSLVQDARRDLPATYVARATTSYLAARPTLARPSMARPTLDRAAFEAAFAICAAQRHLRVAALWVRLDRRDGKPAYLQHGPRCWAMLDAALAHPATAPLAAFLDQHVPHPLRRNPG